MTEDRTNDYEVLVAWGDCDAAGIVFYPNYFKMFNAATDALFASAGFPLRRLIDEFGTVGYPMITTSAQFHLPNRFGDELVIRSRALVWGRSSFEIEHQVFKDGVLSLTGHEKRVWAQSDGAGGIKSLPIPDAIKAAV